MSLNEYQQTPSGMTTVGVLPLKEVGDSVQASLDRVSYITAEERAELQELMSRAVIKLSDSDNQRCNILMALKSGTMSREEAGRYMEVYEMIKSVGGIHKIEPAIQREFNLLSGKINAARLSSQH